MEINLLSKNLSGRGNGNGVLKEQGIKNRSRLKAKKGLDIKKIFFSLSLFLLSLFLTLLSSWRRRIVIRGPIYHRGDLVTNDGLTYKATWRNMSRRRLPCRVLGANEPWPGIAALTFSPVLSLFPTEGDIFFSFFHFFFSKMRRGVCHQQFSCLKFAFRMF